MYIYLLSFIIVTFLCFISIRYTLSNKWLYFEVALLAGLLAFRYGQGTDYFAYSYLFSQFSSISNVIHNPSGVHSEIGFRLLCLIFKDFDLMVAVISIYEILMTVIFLKKHNFNNYVVIFLLFHTIYLTYYFSTLRQGIVLATFIGIGIPFIENKSWKHLIVLSILLSSIHTVALCWLIIPLIKYFDLSTLLRYLLPTSLMLGLMMSTGIFKSAILNIPYFGSYISPYLNESISLFAISERILTLGCISILIFNLFEEDEKLLNIYKIYLIGNILYFFLTPYTLLASRIIICFRIIELVLIPVLMIKPGRYRQLISIYFLILPVLFYFHNISGYLSQGNYFSEINVVNYPYVSVFNKEDIWNYRASNLYYEIRN